MRKIFSDRPVSRPTTRRRDNALYLAVNSSFTSYRSRALLISTVASFTWHYPDRVIRVHLVIGAPSQSLYDIIQGIACEDKASFVS